MHMNITTISASEMGPIILSPDKNEDLIYLQTTFIHLIAPLLRGHPCVGTSKFQAGGLVQSLKVPPYWNWCTQGAPSSINLFLLLGLVLPAL